MSLLKWISLWVLNMYEHEGQVTAVCSWPTGNCTLRTITWTLLHNKLDNLWLRGGGGWGQYSRVSSLQACCLLKDLASWLKLASTEVNLSSLQFRSVQFSCSVMSNPLWAHWLQHARTPCPSPTSGVYLNSCPLSWWCQPSHPLPSPSPPAFNLTHH